MCARNGVLLRVNAFIIAATPNPRPPPCERRDGRGRTGIVYQAIDLTELTQGLVEQRRDIRILRHVGADEGQAKTLFENRSLGFPPTGGDDGGALFEKTSAIFSPMPLVAPVTIATLPSRIPMIPLPPPLRAPHGTAASQANARRQVPRLIPATRPSPYVDG